MQKNTLFTRRSALWTFAACCPFIGLAACYNDDGPAEDVGEAIDDAADEVEDAAEDVDDALDKDKKE